MSRHSKNNTASSVFTYYERKKIKDFGSKRAHFGGENLRRFEDCWLCLRPAVKPVCTPRGFIYCKECIISNFASQKEEKYRSIAVWERRQQQKHAETDRLEREKKEKEIASFLESNETVVLSKNEAQLKSLSNNSDLIQLDKNASRAASFWVAENTPDARTSDSSGNQTQCITTSAIADPPPSKQLVCPITKIRLKLKDLVDLKPEVLVSSGNHDAKWLCSLTKREVAYQKAYAIKSTGQVILEECLKQGLLKGMGKHGSDLTSRDLISLIPGGSGFSSHNQTETKVHGPVME